MPIPIVRIAGDTGNDLIDLQIERGGGVAGNLDGRAGNDSLRGGGYADTLDGGDNSDLLDGRAGADVILGGNGADTIVLRPGSPGRDTIQGGSGRDTLVLRITEAQDADRTLRTEIANAQAAIAADPGGRYVGLGADFRGIDSLVVEVIPNRRGTNLDRIDTVDFGIRLTGENAGDQAGTTVAALGDVNGDGLADVLVGAPGSDAGGVDSGAAYVVFGTARGAPADLGAIAAGRGGYRITGQSAGDLAGAAIAGAGDVNGDGIGDLIVGAPGDDEDGDLQVGSAYVVFGGASGPIDLGAIGRGNGGFRIMGASNNDYTGFDVGAAGDFNGDGLADLLVAAPTDDGLGRRDAGAVHVVFGKANGSTIAIADVQGGSGGVTIAGEGRFDESGLALAGGGDVNGDGFADIVIGAWQNDGPGGADSGAAYVVFGRPRMDAVDLADVARGRGGFKMTGERSGDEAGFSVAIAGDINADGLADVAVGARGNENGGNFDSGAAYIVFGRTETTTIALDDVGRRNGGFEIQGESSSDQLGWAVAAAGDVNGDGLADVLLGATLNDSDNRFQNGAVYVLYGKTDNETVDLDNVRDGIGGFKIRGEFDSDFAGRSIDAAGDVNGDGFADLLIGAPGNDGGGDDAGAAYILFGSSGWLG